MNRKLDGQFPLKAEAGSRHQCLIYDGAPSRQLPALAATIKQQLAEGRRCLYLNSRPMVAGIRSCLAAMNIDVERELAKGGLVLSSEPVGSAEGGFDVDVLLRQLEDALDQATNDGYKGLWATGDMTWEFGAEKNFTRLVEYERGLEDLFQKRPELCGICQYHQDTLPREVTRQALLTHGTLFINETLARLNPHFAPHDRANDSLATDAELDESIAALGQLQNTKNLFE